MPFVSQERWGDREADAFAMRLMPISVLLACSHMTQVSSAIACITRLSASSQTSRTWCPSSAFCRIGNPRRHLLRLQRLREVPGGRGIRADVGPGEDGADLHAGLDTSCVSLTEYPIGADEEHAEQQHVGGHAAEARALLGVRVARGEALLDPDEQRAGCAGWS